MKVAVMQPYFFPYLGYFQLINAVDIWVNMDHAKFIKKGYMHKNTIQGNQIIRVPLLGASQNLNTREIKVDLQSKDLIKLRSTLEHQYKKTPFFQQAIEMFDLAISLKPQSLAELNFQIIKNIHSYLGMNTKLLNTSIGMTNKPRTEGIIEIVKNCKGSEYINAIGGRDIYENQSFLEHGVNLKFLNMTSEHPEDRLSIFHLLANLPTDEIKCRLDCYELVS